jgi:hypothetical protein
MSMPDLTIKGVRQEVRCHTRDHTITESIDGDRHALHDLVERRLSSPAVRLYRAEGVVVGHLGFFPCVVCLPRGHEDRECIAVS